jgi:hypothetical protein
VEMRGSDGQIHATTLDASSLYDAADKATRGWAMLYWFTSKEPVIVKRGDQTWTVSQDSMRRWRDKQKSISRP